MKSLKYFIQFIIIFFFFILFKLLGLKLSSIISGKIISYIGPFCRPKKIIYSNILKALILIQVKLNCYPIKCGLTMEEFYVNILL